MKMNGVVRHETIDDPKLLATVRAEALKSERRDIIRERETLLIRHRVQQRIGASAEQLAGIVAGLEQCETALMELDTIAKEWHE